MSCKDNFFRDNSTNTETISQRTIIVLNNLRAIAIFVLVFVVNLLFMFLLGGIGFIVGNVMSIILFVVLGYKYIKLTKVKAWMSVLLLTIVLGTAFILGYFADFVIESEAVESFLPSILGLPIIYPMDALRLFVLIPLGVIADTGGALPASAIFYNSIMTIFLPPLLIYLGLRLKMWRQLKKKSL